ncbi:low temperature requirement protein A [Hymenobacter chitinivorans]|uniref:Low temperature requirement protein LtrA n=1 Tax=Hymenobacter chitinivorans DSM 11115 TaxID=1121954 RepID=A0A2M9BSP0_9BACT|nr:low temperature requirement protein A [Hymenobacter chitinivorans]PJJ60965.1 low temperature requirement protein LtrA [Hymenobacter chitinivorans DSM 11115]
MHNKPSNLWWGPPTHFDDRRYERKISWLELFYDLVYAAAIGQLTHQLATHPSWPVACRALLLFCLVFWSWINGSQYYDLHGNDSIRTRLLTFWQMLAVAAVAITIPDAFAGHPAPFALAFLCLQSLITYLWWSVGLYDPSHRTLNLPYTVCFSLAFGLLTWSIFTPAATASGLWVGALLLNLAPPLVGARRLVRILAGRGQVFTASAAIVERFGLFTIIVLAESILGAVTGLAGGPHQSPAAWGAFTLAILIAFLLWCLYFDMTSEQETKTGYGYLQGLIFLLLHLPLLAALSVVGACLKDLLALAETMPPPNLQWMFCAALAVIVWMIVGLTRIMQEEEEDRAYIRPVARLLLGTGAALLLVPALAPHLPTLAFLGLVAGLLLVPVLLGVRSWVRYKFLAGRPAEHAAGRQP